MEFMGGEVGGGREVRGGQVSGIYGRKSRGRGRSEERESEWNWWEDK